MHDQVTELAQRGKALLPEDRSRLAAYDRGETNRIDADEDFAKARSIAR